MCCDWINTLWQTVLCMGLCDINMDKYIILNECKREMMCIYETWIWYGFNAWVYLGNTHDKLYVHEKYMWHMLCAKPTGIDY